MPAGLYVSLVVADIFLEKYQVNTVSHLQQIFPQGEDIDNDEESSLCLKPADFALLFNEFNRTSLL